MVANPTWSHFGWPFWSKRNHFGTVETRMLKLLTERGKNSQLRLFVTQMRFVTWGANGKLLERICGPSLKDFRDSSEVSIFFVECPTTGPLPQISSVGSFCWKDPKFSVAQARSSFRPSFGAAYCPCCCSQLVEQKMEGWSWRIQQWKHQNHL